ncbi:hypothetical protein CHUAL_009358 [Chamberlinius hualienensis]
MPQRANITSELKMSNEILKNNKKRFVVFEMRSSSFEGITVSPCKKSVQWTRSSSTDLGCRRGVFSRRHYGSVELLAHVECEGLEQQTRRFRVECGEHVDKDEIYSSPSTPVLENPEYQTRWYFKYFLGRVHQNYVGADSEKIPFFLSVVLIDSNNQYCPQYRAVLWKRTGAQKICISHSPNKPMTVKSISSNFNNMDKIEKGPKEIFAPEIQKDLLVLEEQEGSVNFKFGVLLARAGQTTDDEMYSNENGSKDFDRFIALLGDKVRLKGWDKYRGGLDVKGDMTGKYSVYTIYEGHEIMFHVSTLLPYSKDNKQQVERKRHIGNDIVNIIFVEGDSADVIHFKPTMIKSQFTHIFAVVSYNSTDDAYRLSMFSEETVPLFGPTLPCPNIFHNSQEFREFLLVKLINGEKAAFNTPIFSQKRERTLDMLIKDLFTEHMSENRSTMLNRRAFSDVFPEAPRGNRRKEEARQVEFVRFGQALKLDTIVKGDAPTSLATTSLYKREPWEPQCFYPDFPYDIICGDSWGDSRLIVATESGIFDIDEGMSHRLIFDKSVLVKQLNVIEAHGIFLFRTDKGRDSKVHVFRLSDFDDNICSFARSKCDLKDHKLERTKGCHLYSVSRAGGSHLRVVVAVGKKLLIMQWRHSAAWTAWCPSSDTDTVDGFQYIREISITESPVLMTLIDNSMMNEDNQICVGYKHQFDLINEKSGESMKLHQVEGNKQVHLVAAADIYEDEEAELLLCYNHTSHFQKLNEETSNEFDFQWTSVPEAIVCAFPYILAFTSDTIEIRLIINGNLIQTMVMPRLGLVSSKNDIYFSTTAPEFFQVRNEWIKVDKLERDPSLSPPSSPHSTNGDGKPLRLYRIPFSNLTGGNLSLERRVPSPCTPIPKSLCCASHMEMENNERCNTVTGTSRHEDGLSKEMHLRVSDRPERGSRSGPTTPVPTTPVLLHCPPKRGGLCKERNHSASSDSGIGKSLGCSPPPSPQIFSDNSDDYTNEGFSSLSGSKI